MIKQNKKRTKKTTTKKRPKTKTQTTMAERFYQHRQKCLKELQKEKYARSIINKNIRRIKKDMTDWDKYLLYGE